MEFILRNPEFKGEWMQRSMSVPVRGRIEKLLVLSVTRDSKSSFHHTAFLATDYEKTKIS